VERNDCGGFCAPGHSVGSFLLVSLKLSEDFDSVIRRSPDGVAFMDQDWPHVGCKGSFSHVLSQPCTDASVRWNCSAGSDGHIFASKSRQEIRVASGFNRRPVAKLVAVVNFCAADDRSCIAKFAATSPRRQVLHKCEYTPSVCLTGRCGTILSHPVRRGGHSGRGGLRCV
jgi:hypothetical protein